MRIERVIEIAESVKHDALRCGDTRGADALEYVLTLVRQERDNDVKARESTEELRQLMEEAP